MAKKCSLCGTTTIFYVWTTSGIFPREKFPGYNEMTPMQKLFLKRVGYPVCFACFNKIKQGKI